MTIQLKCAAGKIFSELLSIATHYGLTEDALKQHSRAVVDLFSRCTLGNKDNFFCDEVERSHAEESLHILKSMAPLLCEESILIMAMSYITISPCVYWNGELGVDDFLGSITETSWGIGFVVGRSPRIGEMPDHVRKKKLSEAGRLGGLNKSKKSAELKAWALAEADRQRGADMEIARKLAASLPPHLADASASPERLIYEALRSRRKMS